MIVFDSSTLILLPKVEILELFVSNIGRRVLIPERVRSEVMTGREKETPLIAKLLESKTIEVRKTKDLGYIKKLTEDFNIGAGEAEAITLAIQEGANLIATDDKNAIRACKMLGLEFITAIAILIRFFQKGLFEMDDALFKLEKLQSFGKFSRAIIEDAKKQIEGDI